MTWRYVGLYDFLSIFAVTVIAAFLLMLSVLLPVGFLKKGGQLPVSPSLCSGGGLLYPGRHQRAARENEKEKREIGKGGKV